MCASRAVSPERPRRQSGSRAILTLPGRLSAGKRLARQSPLATKRRRSGAKKPHENDRDDVIKFKDVSSDSESEPVESEEESEDHPITTTDNSEVEAVAVAQETEESEEEEEHSDSHSQSPEPPPSPSHVVAPASASASDSELSDSSSDSSSSESVQAAKILLTFRMPATSSSTISRSRSRTVTMSATPSALPTDMDPRARDGDDDDGEDLTMDVSDSDVDSNSDSDADAGRPNKRVKTNTGDHSAVNTTVAPSSITTSSTVATMAITDNQNIATDEQFATPPASSPVITASGATTISVLSRGNENIHNQEYVSADTNVVSTFSSNALPSNLPIRFSTGGENQSITAGRAVAILPGQDLRMTWISTSSLNELRTNNGILRSHNLSLSRQNAQLRTEHQAVVDLRTQITENGPVNHDNCVRRSDWDDLLAENNELRDRTTTLQHEHALMLECGQEWARRENVWDVERPMLHNEIANLTSRFGEVTMREGGYRARISELENELGVAEGRIRRLEEVITVERQLARVLEERLELAESSFNHQ